MPHRRNIDIDLLRSFVTIIEVKSFTKAADRLLRTQSAISLQMKRLEEQLDCRLFERGGRGVEPTEAGILLLGYARRILSANDELVGRMAEPMVDGEVRLGSPDGFAAEQLAPALARFTRAFPRVGLRVRTGPPDEMGRIFAAGRLDLLISMQLATDSLRPAESDSLGREALVWCAGEGAEPDYSTGLRDQPLKLVANRTPCLLRQVAENALGETDRSWTLVFEAGSRGAVQAAVGAGLGVSVLPRSSLLAGMHRLTVEEGFPELPDIETLLLARPGGGIVSERLRAFLLNVFDQRG